MSRCDWSFVRHCVLWVTLTTLQICQLLYLTSISDKTTSETNADFARKHKNTDIHKTDNCQIHFLQHFHNKTQICEHSSSKHTFSDLLSDLWLHLFHLEERFLPVTLCPPALCAVHHKSCKEQRRDRDKVPIKPATLVTLWQPQDCRRGQHVSDRVRTEQKIFRNAFMSAVLSCRTCLNLCKCENTKMTNHSHSWMCKYRACINSFIRKVTPKKSGKKNQEICKHLRTDPKREMVWKDTLAPIFTHTPASRTHLLRDYRVQHTHTHKHEAEREKNSGVFVHWILKRDEASAGNDEPRIPFICSTSGACIAIADIHPSFARESICVCVWTQPTHSAQKEQHAAHHNWYHNGQLAAAELHFSNNVIKVPHFYLERKREEEQETGSWSFKIVFCSCLLVSSTMYVNLFLFLIFSFASFPKRKKNF